MGKIALDRGFDSFGHSLEPGQKFEQIVPLNRMIELGKYRILKNVNSEESDIKYKIRCCVTKNIMLLYV